MVALVFLFACGGSTIVGADGGGGAGGTAPVPCTDCVPTPVSWGPNGGLVTYTVASSLTSCRTFTYVRTPVTGDPPKQCSVEIDGCDTAAIAVHDIEQALAHPDVTAAFAGATTLYGTDPRPCDGSVLDITVDGHTVEVGGECGQGGSCSPGACVPVPAGLRALATTLVALEQQSLKVGACAQTFP